MLWISGSIKSGLYPNPFVTFFVLRKAVLLEWFYLTHEIDCRLNVSYSIEAMYNSPPPSSKISHFQNEAKCSAFLVKMSFICMRMKTHFHIKGWALNLGLKQRPGGTGKWPTAIYCILFFSCFFFFFFFSCNVNLARYILTLDTVSEVESKNHSLAVAVSPPILISSGLSELFDLFLTLLWSISFSGNYFVNPCNMEATLTDKSTLCWLTVKLQKFNTLFP